MIPVTLAIIPARGGSKGLPRKNLALVGGVPLVARAIRTCFAAGIADVVVTTDDDEISTVATAAGALVVRRPASLSTDLASSEDAIMRALETVGAHEGVCAFVQCTTPLLRAAEVAECVARARNGASAFTVVEHHNVFWTARGEPLEPLPRKPRQQTEPLFKETGGCYAFPIAAFLRTGSRFPTMPVMVHSAYGIDVDTEEDIVIANALVRRERPRVTGVDTLILDFDGVLSDNSVLTASDGTELIKCSKSDSTGLLMAREAGLDVIVLTHELDTSVARRCAKLGIACVQTEDPKLGVLRAMVKDLARACYVGNDTADVECMRACGVSMAPADASPGALRAAAVVLTRNGGDGAVREAVEMILEGRQ